MRHQGGQGDDTYASTATEMIADVDRRGAAHGSPRVVV